MCGPAPCNPLPATPPLKQLGVMQFMTNSEFANYKCSFLIRYSFNYNGLNILVTLLRFRSIHFTFT